MTTRNRRHLLPGPSPLLIAGAVLLVAGNVAHPLDRLVGHCGRTCRRAGRRRPTDRGPTPFTINVLLRPVAIAGTAWFLAFGVAVRRLDLTERKGSGISEDAGVAPT